MWWLKLICIIPFVAIVFQDIKNKKVSWIWFLILALALAFLHYMNSLPEVFISHTLINLGFVVLILLLLYAYVKLRSKHQFLKAIGTGDICMFLALSPSMASISFIVCFAFSIIMALVLSIVFDKNDKNQIPLAGYMSLFFLIIYIANWTGLIDQLYKI